MAVKKGATRCLYATIGVLVLIVIALLLLVILFATQKRDCDDTHDVREDRRQGTEESRLPNRTVFPTDGTIFYGLPNITVFPTDGTIFYNPGDTFQIDCEASGEPSLTFQWKRNGYLFSPDGIGDRVSQLPGNGTIVYKMALDKDEGYYQCFVSNNLGVSVSPKVFMRAARLDEFFLEPLTHLITTIGQSINMRCIPPRSIPRPGLFWAVQDENGAWQHIQTDGRVTMDTEGNLHIGNVVELDENGGRPYTCLVMNPVIRRIVYGPQYELQVMGGTPAQQRAEEQWASPSDHFVLRGQALRLKYICSGNPTPTVTWTRINGSLSSNAEIRENGTELFIPRTEYQDAGQYMASCVNQVTPNPLMRIFYVRVNSAPEWTNPPRDVNVNVGDDAVIVCKADGIPEPKVDWYINGVMLDKSSDHTTGHLSFEPNGTAVVLRDLRLDDRMVIQCNATNRNGYVWGDVSVNVIG